MNISHDEEPSMEDFLATAESDVFRKLADRLREGTYYPPKDDTEAEHVALVDELGWAAAFSTVAEQIEDPQLIHGVRCRPEVGISTEFWLTPAGIDVQHSSWDEAGDPHPTDERHPIHPEELLELHGLIVDG